MGYLDEATKSAEKLIRAIDRDPDVDDATRRTILRYVDFMRARGLTDRTIWKNLYTLSNFLKVAPRKSILKMDKDDIMGAVATVERSKYSEKTKQNVKVSIKSFYKHFLGEDEYYPENVRWIKTTMKGYRKVLPEDILTEEDIMRMLKASGNLRDKAIIALLFDSGIRIGEFLGMRVKDVDLESQPAHITVNGKTGMRKIPVLFSVPYLAALLNLRGEARPEEALWLDRGTWSEQERPIDRSGVARMLEVTARKAGVTKRVNPHSFRHARATYYANRLTEQQLKALFGWTGDSRMASVYVHMSGRDIDNAVLQANGLAPKDAAEVKLKARPCPKCRYANTVEATYCTRCGSPMDISTAVNDEEREREAKELAARAMQERDIERTLERELRKARKGRKRGD